MSELAELERRITDALDRIGKGLERLGTPAAETSDTSDTAAGQELAVLREALNDERTANAQLEERVRTLRRKDEARIKELEDEIDDLKAAASEADSQLQQSRKVIQNLQAANQETASVDDAVMQKLKQQLNKLRKVRDDDRAELDAILGTLKPLLEEETNA